uniref:Bms1-type G domain-containing protein n=1 Tax=Scylla olivacea TaxID=85551 RepID=A0A0P4WGX0_SCYOL
MGDLSEDFDKKKSHSQRHAGRKAEKKEAKNKHVQELTPQQRNPKASAFQSAVKAQRKFARSQDIKSKKHHIPVVDRTPLEPPPVIVAVVGGPRVGKSTLMRCLIKNYTNQRFSEITGPITVVAGKKRRLTFIEVNNDINCMIDIAKVADIVLMLIDATFGIEMEIFEFLEICRAHGTPRVMGVLNHLDMLKDNKSLKKRKKSLKHRFQVELYPGAKLFYLSGLIHEEYLKNEIKNLGRFISVMKFRPLTWRTTHPFVIVDRYEDITNPETLRTNSKCDRNVVLYGYVRGIPFHQFQPVHIPGCGDYKLKDISFLPDPCPLPEHMKKRALNAKERLTYAPLSGVGGVVYDKDAVYIDLGGSHHGNKNKNIANESEDEDDVFQPLLDLQKTTDEKQAQSQIQLFPQSKFIGNDDFNEEQGDNTKIFKDGSGRTVETVKDSTGRIRRRPIFSDGLEDEDSNDDDEESESDESMSDEEESEEDVSNEMEPPRKKTKSTSHVKEDAHKSSSGSDSEDYDLDADLKEVQKTQAGQDSQIESLLTNRTETSIPHRTPHLKNNSSSSVTAKLQGLLEKISTSTSQQLKTNDTHDMSDEKELSENKPDEDDSDEDDTDGDEDVKAQYRKMMLKQASSDFYKSQSTVSFLRKFIYTDVKEEEDSSSEEDDNNIGGLFYKVSQSKSSKHLSQTAMDEVDTSRYIPPALRDWSKDEVFNSIKDCFVTGEWKESENAQTLLKMDDDGDIYGDFEDLESGKKFTADSAEANKEEIDENIVPQHEDKEKSAKEKLVEKKRRLKEMFDAEYDEKGNGDHFDSLKAEMSQQAQLNRAEFEGLDDEARVQYEGYRPGMYVRMEFDKFPCEFITNFNASYPVIVGGLLENESNMGFIRIRIKLHRWYPKILKNRDPLILSLGWRRFQTLMYYAKREDNFRMRSLKYARKYMHVEAMCWGPITAINTGFIALQNITDRVPEFRIAANGVVLEADQSCKIVKKLKLMGTPEKILKKTAFIKDMFHSDTEIAKFEGAKIETQSGIRGIIKKFQGDRGHFRATFEDVIKMSDVIILKTWVPLEMAKHCFPVRTLLLPPSEKAAWQGMKTVAQVKKNKGIKNLANPDSLYTPITKRREYVPLPLKVPKELQKALPYSEKPKITPKAAKEQRVIVVKDPKEIEMDSFMKRLKTMMEDKIQKEEKEKEERRKKFQKDIDDREHMRQVREKRKKAAACRIKSKKYGKKDIV